MLAEIANDRQEKQIKSNRTVGHTVVANLKILYLYSAQKAVFLGTEPWPKKCCKYLQIICCREFKKHRPYSKFKYSISGSLNFSFFNGFQI
jgi:hypothetical protein